MDTPVEEFQISTVLNSDDEINKRITFSTMGMVMGLSVNNMIIHDKKKWDEYAMRIIQIGKGLQKANSHLKKYKAEEEIFLHAYLEKHTDKEQNINSSDSALSLTAELDAFLSQFKSVLDTLSKTFDPLYGLKFTTWGKKLDLSDNKEKSGLKIIDSFNRNLKGDEKSKAEPLIEFITKNLDWVTHHVNMRDSASHHGGIKNVSDVIYNYKDKKVYPQSIKYRDHSELVTVYMERTLNQLIDYVTRVLILSLEAKAPTKDMFIVKMSLRNFHHING